MTAFANRFYATSRDRQGRANGTMLNTLSTKRAWEIVDEMIAEGHTEVRLFDDRMQVYRPRPVRNLPEWADRVAVAHERSCGA